MYFPPDPGYTIKPSSEGSGKVVEKSTVPRYYHK